MNEHTAAPHETDDPTPPTPISLLHPPAGELVEMRVPTRWAPAREGDAPMLLVGYETQPLGSIHDAIDGEAVVLVPLRLADFVASRGRQLLERLGGEFALWHTQTAGFLCHQRYVLGLHLPMTAQAQLGALQVAQHMLDSNVSGPAPLNKLIEYRDLMANHLDVSVDAPDTYPDMEEAFYPLNAAPDQLAKLISATTDEAALLLTAGQLEKPNRNDDPSSIPQADRFERFLLLSRILHDRVGIWIAGENCD